MKISHSLQSKMFWPGQAGLGISAACQESCIEGKTQFKVHWAALDNRTPWMAAISTVWKVSTAHLNTFVITQCSPPPCTWKGSRIPLGFIAWSVIQPFRTQEPALWSSSWQRRRQQYPRRSITIDGTKEELSSKHHLKGAEQALNTTLVKFRFREKGLWKQAFIQTLSSGFTFLLYTPCLKFIKSLCLSSFW